MSINALANAAAARRPDLIPLGTVPKDLQDIASASMTSPSATVPSATRMDGALSGAGPVDTAFNVLFGYIPTEVITLYVAVLAAIQTGGDVATQGDWITFWSFLAATPVVVWLVYGAKLKGARKSIPARISTWPVWEMSAATIAFSAWAFALPHSPFMKFDWYSSALSGVAVLIVSTVLGLLSPFFQRPLRV